MVAPLILLACAVTVLLWLRAMDGASRILAEKAGVPHDGRRALWSMRVVMVLMIAIVAMLFIDRNGSDIAGDAPALASAPPPDDGLWHAPDTALIPALPNAELVRYGRQLIANTAAYFGPHGSLGQRANGMNCQNCHLDAGTRPWGNNYGSVASLYPKFRERSGTKEGIVKRVNDCIERSLNGNALDSTSLEMQAIVSYIKWVGSAVPKGEKAKASGLMELAYLDRAADPARGKLVFLEKCITCHKPDGQGQLNADGRTYLYPPLWGPNSYNHGAGLYRLSRIAGYVKANMPQGVTWDRPQLTDEQAWDVAAYVNSQERPAKDLSTDWPNLAGKPVDHPFGPYADTFTEVQHKYGPFAPIEEARAAATKK